MTEDKSPTTALLLSIFLGGLGVDRFYLGHVGLGLGKLFTGGGLGVWWLIDIFLIQEAARKA
ncbi:MAG: TM2 domain-containing protein [bacterium]|nr:TM2 domain-containing protein [bacterium]